MPRPRKYPWLVVSGDATLRGVDPRLLRRLNSLGDKLQKQIVITSGFRSHAEQEDLWRNAEKYGLVRGKTVARPGSSRHESGLALDATIDGQAIGSAVSAKMLASVGLTALAGDLVHVELAGKAGEARAQEPSQPTEPTTPEFDQEGYEQRVAAATPNAQTPVSAGVTGPPGLAPPGSVDIPYSPRRFAAETWQQLAAQPYASPDTLRLAEKAKALLDA